MPFGPFSPRGPIRVQPFFGFRNANRLFLNARALRAHEPIFEKSTFWRDVATMMGQFASHEIADLPVTLEYKSASGTLVSQQIMSGPEGFIRFDIAFDAAHAQTDTPKRTKWEKALLRWEQPGGEVEEATAYILTPGSETKIGVISDIDDTILETGITGNIRAIARNWRRLVEMPSDRVLVPGANAFYSAIGGKAARAIDPASAIDALLPEARVRPVFYVSSSPWNLFSYLVTFKRDRGLPLGPVMLRDWGFNRKTLGKEGHGSHKREAIARIFKTFPHLRFALIGDDSQKDIAAFASIAAAYPGRVAAVFIRSVSGGPLTDEQLNAKAGIEEAGVPYWSGNDYSAAEQFLQSAGLDFEGGVERLVRTATKGR